jgi:hypothetical protein
MENRVSQAGPSQRIDRAYRESDADVSVGVGPGERMTPRLDIEGWEIEAPGAQESFALVECFDEHGFVLSQGLVPKRVGGF